MLAILEEILRTEDDTDRNLRGQELAQTLYNEFLLLWMDDRAEARCAAATFFVKAMLKMTKNQRDQTVDLLQIANKGMDGSFDTESLCNFLTDKLKKID